MGRRLWGRLAIPKASTAFEWDSLGFLRAIGLLRVGYVGTVAIPIYAYCVQSWNAWADLHPPALKLVLPMSLFAAFVGSVLLSVAQLLNEVFCPKVVKVYGTYRGFHSYVAEYVANERVIGGAAWEVEKTEIDEAARRHLPQADDSVRSTLSAVVATHVATVIATQTTPLPGDQALVTHRTQWEIANTAFAPVRYTIGICYVTAALIAAGLIVWQIPRMFSLVVGAV